MAVAGGLMALLLVGGCGARPPTVARTEARTAHADERDATFAPDSAAHRKELAEIAAVVNSGRLVHPVGIVTCRKTVSVPLHEKSAVHGFSPLQGLARLGVQEQRLWYQDEQTLLGGPGVFERIHEHALTIQDRAAFRFAPSAEPAVFCEEFSDGLPPLDGTPHLSVPGTLTVRVRGLTFKGEGALSIAAEGGEAVRGSIAVRARAPDGTDVELSWEAIRPAQSTAHIVTGPGAISSWSASARHP